MAIRTGNEEPPKAYPVVPYIRVVPNGVESVDGERLRLRATLTLTPFWTHGLEQTGFDLTTWPSDVARLLGPPGEDGLTDAFLVSCDVMTKAAPFDRKPLGTAPEIRLAKPEFFAALNDARTGVAALWRDSICPPERRGSPVDDDLRKAAWDALALQISQTLTGERTQVGHAFCEGHPNAAEGADKLGADAQFVKPAPDGPRAVDALLGIPHSDAALVLDAQRARELAQSLGDRGAETERELPETEDPVNAEVWSGNPTKIAEIGAEGPNSPEGIRDAAEHFASDATDVALWEVAFATAYGVAEGQQPIWRETHAATLREARSISIDSAIRQRKIARFVKLSEQLHPDRMSSAEIYGKALEALRDGNQIETCLFTSVSPGEAARDGAKKLSDARVKSEFGLWPTHADDPNARVTAPNVKGGPAPTLDTEAKAKAKAIARQAYFSIEGSPGQSRVFGLSVDILIDLDLSGREVDPSGGVDGAIPSFVALGAILTTGPRLDAAIPAPMTLTRLTDLDPPAAPPEGEVAASCTFGWPASRGEYLAWRKATDPTKLILPSHCVSQYGGVIVMGGLAVNGARLPRYDITSLDVANALEAEKAWLEAIEAARQEIASGGGDRTAAGELRRLLAIGPDYQSNGLTLLCRSAVADAARKLATLTAKTGRETCAELAAAEGRDVVILDADDLTNGFRTFVGTMEAQDGTTRWRSLMGRYFRYDQSGEGGKLVETLLTLAVGPAGSPERIAIESAMNAVPARDVRSLDSSDAGGGAVGIEAFVEEAVAHWDGTPGGVACAGLPEMDEAIPDVMCFGRRSFIPDRPGQDRPPALRYGRPYRFALQAVYAGGRAIDPDTEFPEERLPRDPDAVGSADRSTDLEARGDARARLFYPSRGLASHGGPDARAFVRALRHIRIGAPTLLLPKGHAERQNGAMGFENAGRMVIRTMRDVADEQADSRDQSRATPDISQRLVLVPHLPLATAARHLVEGGARGVLDHRNDNGPPPGALPRVRYAKNNLGFPTVQTRFETGFNGEPYIKSRRTIETPSTETTEPGTENASSVFWHRGSAVATDYYPDPAPSFLVLRARHVEGPMGQRRTLEGRPVAVPLRAGSAYPDTTPVLLTLAKTASRPKDEPPTQSSVLHCSGTVTFDANRSDDVRRGRRLSAEGVEIRLKPGEQVDIEMWLVPSEWRLGHDFAAVQGLIQYFCNCAGADGLCDLGKLRAGIRRSKLPAAVERCLLDALPAVETGLRYIGPGGDVLPGSGIICALAKAMHEAMLCHPLPEIAATRRVTAVHAVNVPKDRAPKVVPLPSSVPAFPGARCDEAAEGRPDAPLPLRAVRPETVDGPVPGFSGADAIAAGAKTVALKGEVEVDLARIDTLEITARTVSPESAVFDDPNRGRSLAHRIAGTWPEAIGGAERDGARDLRAPLDIFGFRVAEDGRVKLREGTVTLLRIEDLPLPQTPGRWDRIALEDYFLSPENARLASLRHHFPDGKARRLSVRVNGLARTAEYLTTAARVAMRGDPWLSGSGLVYERGELVPAERLRPGLMRNRAEEPTDVILPATIRPMMVETKAPVPTLEIEGTGIRREPGLLVIEQTRRASVRLRLRRGWFSSGVDERLGIVLWPPAQLLGDRADLAANVVTLRDPADCPDPCGSPPQKDRVIPLEEFSDEDLGPGGAFVTRRGTDPVRMSSTPSEFHETQLFLSKEAFPDLWRHPNDPGRAEYVPHVEMPLADTDSGGERDGQGNETDGPQDGPDGEAKLDTTPPMAVGLLTYEPRFDVEREEWYADVTLQPGRSADSFVRFGLVRYQTHTRPDLRCSRPVVQWAQPLAERRVRVIYRDGAPHVEIEVRGPVSVGRAFEESNPDTPFATQLQERDRPILRVTAFHDATSPLGGAIRDWLDLSGSIDCPNDRIACAHGVGCREYRAELDGGEGIWTLRLDIDFLAKQAWQVKLALEEIEYFLPADFGEQEPLDDDALKMLDLGVWRERGPTFSSMIDLSQFSPVMNSGD
ncbi:hypothetical protein [uncultured Jannaschia sp.]|uniref:hypothetical protein n=1 Tax=uncultured Jannaschia sp. TaxID=293347 RepID=UPI00260F5549|nr:hypothetical protein [uncultured Jannaschia sp.]